MMVTYLLIARCLGHIFAGTEAFGLDILAILLFIPITVAAIITHRTYHEVSSSNEHYIKSGKIIGVAHWIVSLWAGISL